MNNKTTDTTETVPFEYRLEDYTSALYRRRGMILFMTITAAVLSGVISLAIRPQYEARGVFYVPQDVHDATDIADLKARLPSGVQAHARTFAAVLQESNAVRQVVARLPEEQAKHFRTAIDITATREGLIRIYARDHNPELAAKVVNMIIEIFNEFHQNVIQNDLNAAMANLNNQLKEVNADIESLTGSKKQFCEGHHIASPEVMIEKLEERKADFHKQLDQLAMDKGAYQQRIKNLTDQLDEESKAYLEGEMILQDPVTEALQERLNLLEVEIAGQQVMLSPDHPYMISLQHRYSRAQEALARHMSQVVGSKSKTTGSLYDDLRENLMMYKVELSGVQARIEGLEKAIKVTEGIVRKVPGILAELENLEDRIMQKKMLRQSLETARDRLITSSLQMKTTGLVIRPAAVPRRPVFPLTVLNVLIAGVIGLLAGVLYVLTLEHHETRRRTALIQELRSRHRTNQITQGETSRELTGVS